LKKTKAKFLETPITTSSQHGPGSGLITTPNRATTTTITTARSQKKATTFLFFFINNPVYKKSLKSITGN